MADYKFVTYETLEEGRIARIMLNRPSSATRRIGASWSN
jgi:hypothetical protein